MKIALDKAISRNVFVCCDNGCFRCDSEVRDPPKDCSYKILHPLETKHGGIRAMRRQSGKTGVIVAIANQLATNTTFPVYIVTISLKMAKRIERDYGLDRRVKVLSERPDNRGLNRGFVLFDEVLPGRVREVMRVFPQSLLVCALFTPR